MCGTARRPSAHATPLSESCALTGQPYWTQFHRITGLQPERQYFYRTACAGADGKTVLGEIETFKTTGDKTAVRIPEDLGGTPFVLDRPHTRYLVTRDLTFPLGGILVKADGITLDLDGHTLVYNDQQAIRPEQWDKRAYEEHDYGVKVEGRVRFTLLNGTIRQGKGNSRGTVVGVGCNPVYFGGIASEIAGVEIVWSGNDVSGFYLHGSEGDHVHHCIMDDRGSVITDRHMAIRSISGNTWGDYDHNLVKATRQQGLANGVRVAHNEIYLRSCATNSFGITPAALPAKPATIEHNRILGTGEHPLGIGMFGAFAPGTTVHDNYVEVQCTKSGLEYGYTGCACFRTTWGADHLDVGHNTFIAHAGLYDGKVAKARALWVGLPVFTPKGASQPIADARGFFHDNLIVAQGPEKADAGAICVVCLNESPHLIFKGNTVVSTWGNVLLADSYGHADGYAKFVNNTFRRLSSFSDYHTVRQEYGGIPATGVFVGNRYEEGAREDDVKLLEKGRIAFQQILDVFVKDEQGNPIGGAKVTIRNAALEEVFSGVTAEVAVDGDACLLPRAEPRPGIPRAGGPWIHRDPNRAEGTGKGDPDAVHGRVVGKDCRERCTRSR